VHKQAQRHQTRLQPAICGADGDLAFPKAWTLFGPVGKDDVEPEFAVTKEVPAELTIAGKRLAGQQVVFADSRLDLGALLGGKAEGKTAYLLATVEAEKAMEIDLGAGADWWMKWWVNGEVVCDTLATGNDAHPPTVLDHRFTVRLHAGHNPIAVKVVSGSGSFVLAAGGPREANEFRQRRAARLKACNERGRAAIARFKQEWATQATTEADGGFGQNPANGTWRKATVPYTLDLADRARFAVNALVGTIMPQFSHECLWMQHVLAPSGYPHTCQWSDHNPRVLWALTLLRLMTGSRWGLDLEEKALASMLEHTTPEGYYLMASLDTPGAWWRKGGAGGRKDRASGEAFTTVAGMAALLKMLTDRWLRDDAPALRERARQVAEALSRIAIRKDDYAYYPATTDFGMDYAYLPGTGWPDTKEALSDQDDPEGAVTAYHAIVVHALCSWHAATGDAKALETAGLLVSYMLKPRFWTGGCSPWTEAGGTDLHNAQEIRAVHGGAERKPSALFQGHQAGMTYTFTGLIDYAIAANDTYVKDWVRQGYEYFRNLGLARIGMWGENIANNQMAAIAIKLSDAGVGDYWDDVDEYVRNAFVEDQFVDLDLLEREAAKHGLPTWQQNEFGEFSLPRVLGCLRHEGLIDGEATMDPTCNRAKGGGTDTLLYGSCYLEPFYFAWESITRCQDGAAQVNLLLNRASPWLDIDSHLPYEGKVVLHNQGCHALSVRLPRWADRRAVACRIDDRTAAFGWAGNYLVLGGLGGQETVTIEFPMVEWKETAHLLTRNVGRRWWEHTAELPTYVLHMRGGTCVKVEFPNRDRFTSKEPVYPVFQRGHMRGGPVPLKEATRFVPDRIVASW